MLSRKQVVAFSLLGVAALLLVVSRYFTLKTYVSGPPILERVVDFSKELVDSDVAHLQTAAQTPQPFQFDAIFNDRPLTEEKCEGCTSLMVTGDVLTARTVNQKTVAMNNFHWPFEKTAEVLRSADITFINLETPFVSNCPIRTDGMVFCGDPRNVQGLQFAGVDVVTFANNHAGNAGKTGVEETMNILKNAGMQVIGVTGPAIREVNGIKFGFVGLNDVEKYGFIADVTGDRLQQEIQQARTQSDVVVVQFHWGEEYRYQPTQRQRQLAKDAIDAGADLVVSNHPHWIQAVEKYKDTLIVYSHGNFVFDQMWSQQTREGIVGRYTFQGKTLVDVAFFPVFIENFGQPRWLEGKEKTRILEILKKESQTLSTKPL